MSGNGCSLGECSRQTQAQDFPVLIVPGGSTAALSPGQEKLLFSSGNERLSVQGFGAFPALPGGSQPFSLCSPAVGSSHLAGFRVPARIPPAMIPSGIIPLPGVWTPGPGFSQVMEPMGSRSGRGTPPSPHTGCGMMTRTLF